MVEPVLAPDARSGERRPALGYAMVWIAAALFAVNGTVSKVILESGVSAFRLTQLRSAGAFAGLGVLLVLLAPRTLRVRRSELPSLALFGVAGLVSVQLFYFVAIHRLPVGIALLVQYLAPLLVALWARVALHEDVRRRVWAAIALALAGLALVARVWDGLTLDALGLAAALAAALAYAVYVLLAERAVARRDTLSLSFYGFGFATLFWLLVQPPWSFPAEAVARDAPLLGNLAGHHAPVWALAAWMVVLGTIAPFALVVGALRHVPATRVGIVAMLEPVLAGAVAWAWLAESLAAAQLAGAAVVTAAIILAQTAR